MANPHDLHYNLHQQCPFGKNRGAGSWLIPSIIIETCNLKGFFQTPLQGGAPQL